MSPACCTTSARIPGVSAGRAGRVQGEVYAISAELERQLDEIEEV